MTEATEVTQADRDAAADAFAALGQWTRADRASDGELDRGSMVQAIARHRAHFEAQALAQGRLEGVEAEKARCIAFLRTRADEIAPPESEGDDPLWAANAYLHGAANDLESQAIANQIGEK